MSSRRRYRKKADHPVVAVRLDLDTNGHGDGHPKA